MVDAGTDGAEARVAGAAGPGDVPRRGGGRLVGKGAAKKGAPPGAPPPRPGIRATIVSIRHRWYAEFVRGGLHHRLTVSRRDAWNFDIERGLPVEISLRSGRVRILRKSRGNKRYVTI